PTAPNVTRPAFHSRSVGGTVGSSSTSKRPADPGLRLTMVTIVPCTGPPAIAIPLNRRVRSLVQWISVALPSTTTNSCAGGPAPVSARSITVSNRSRFGGTRVSSLVRATSSTENVPPSQVTATWSSLSSSRTCSTRESFAIVPSTIRSSESDSVPSWWSTSPVTVTYWTSPSVVATASRWCASEANQLA